MVFVFGAADSKDKHTQTAIRLGNLGGSRPSPELFTFLVEWGLLLLAGHQKADIPVVKPFG